MSGATTQGLCWGCKRAYGQTDGPSRRLAALAVRVAARASSFLLMGALVTLCALIAAIMVFVTTDHVVSKLRMVAPSEVRAVRSAPPPPATVAPTATPRPAAPVPTGKTQAELDRESQQRQTQIEIDRARQRGLPLPTPRPVAPAGSAGKTQVEIDRERLWGTPTPQPAR